ncbi:MAG TPA: hypothetical protein VMW11_10265 [Candidatus Dormibacteraeota bacterium]|nr:hypothetical protein [Candidatus Dormibacteraeota bacterium]
MSDQPNVIPMIAYGYGPSDARATILSPVEEGAVEKRYRAEDLEGHRRMLTQS